jgi:hypothetical protein
MRLGKIIRSATIIAAVFIFGALGIPTTVASAETSDTNRLETQKNTRQRHRDGTGNPADEQLNKKLNNSCDPDNGNQNRYRSNDSNSNSSNNSNGNGGNKNKGNKNKDNKNNGNKTGGGKSNGKGKGKTEVKPLNN